MEFTDKGGLKRAFLNGQDFITWLESTEALHKDFMIRSYRGFPPVGLQAVWQSPLPRLLAFDNCEDEGIYQCRLAYAGFARNAYHLAAYITLPHQLEDGE